MTDLSYLESLAKEDRELVTNLVALFENQAPEFCTELGTLLRQQAAEETKKSAHTFKGVCLNLGLNDLAQLCKSLEDAALSRQFEESFTLLARLESETNKTLSAMRRLT